MDNTILDWVMIGILAAVLSIMVYCGITGSGTDTYDNYYNDHDNDKMC